MSSVVFSSASALLRKGASKSLLNDVEEAFSSAAKREEAVCSDLLLRETLRTGASFSGQAVPSAFGTALTAPYVRERIGEEVFDSPVVLRGSCLVS